MAIEEQIKKMQEKNTFKGKIGKKLAFVLIFIALIFFGGNATVFYFETLQKTDGARIDASGRNRMLSQRIGYYSELVVNDGEYNQETLISLIELHDKSFYSLKNGGVAPGIANDRLLPPTEQNIMPVVLHAEELWIEYKKSAEIIANNEIYVDGQINPEVKQALSFIEDNISEMLDRNNEMVKEYVNNNDEKQALLMYILFAISFIGFISLMVIAYVDHSIVKSITRVTNVAQDISAGNLKSRSDIKSNDELGFLSQVINAMADNILESRLNLEEKVRVRTEKLNQLTEELKKQKQGLQEVLNDVSSEKNKIDTILYSIGDGVLVVDKDLKIFIFNKAATKISGFESTEVLNKIFDENLKFVDEEEEENHEDRGNFIREAIEKDELQKLPAHCNLIKKDGKLVSIAATASPLKDENNEVIGCAVAFKDISKETQIDKSKSEFVSLASHQLRTPLTAISWYVELLTSGDVGKLSIEQKKYLDVIHLGSKRMIDLVNTLLNVSRLELGTFIVDAQLFDIVQIAKNAISEQVALMNDRKISIVEKYDELPKINLDEKLMIIVFQNLLSNAIKYSLEGSEININIYKNEKYVMIEVADKGIGIPKEQQDKIFTKFHRADNAKEVDASGSGLGLYIVKSILEHSGGKIEFVSEENKGATFKVSIPLEGMKSKEGTKELDLISN